MPRRIVLHCAGKSSMASFLANTLCLGQDSAEVWRWRGVECNEKFFTTTTRRLCVGSRSRRCTVFSLSFNSYIARTRTCVFSLSTSSSSDLVFPRNKSACETYPYFIICMRTCVIRLGTIIDERVAKSNVVMIFGGEIGRVFL